MDTQAEAPVNQETPPPPPQHASEAEAQSDRDLCGRFKAGNLGGPGNPFARQTANLRKSIVTTSTPEQVQALTKKIYAMAMDGDLTAAKLYLSYAVGKPEPVADPDRVDIHEWQIYRDTSSMKAESAPLMSAGTPDFHLYCMRTMRPVVSANMQSELVNMLNKPVETPAEREKREAAELAEFETYMRGPAPEVPEEIAKALWPSTNGPRDELPSVISGNSMQPPSTNGNRRHSPSTNGNSKHSPSTNGKKRRSKKKQRGKRMPQPSTNGRFRFAT